MTNKQKIEKFEIDKSEIDPFMFMDCSTKEIKQKINEIIDVINKE